MENKLTSEEERTNVTDGTSDGKARDLAASVSKQIPVYDRDDRAARQERWRKYENSWNEKKTKMAGLSSHAEREEFAWGNDNEQTPELQRNADDHEWDIRDVVPTEENTKDVDDGNDGTYKVTTVRMDEELKSSNPFDEGYSSLRTPGRGLAGTEYLDSIPVSEKKDTDEAEGSGVPQDAPGPDNHVDGVRSSFHPTGETSRAGELKVSLRLKKKLDERIRLEAEAAKRMRQANSLYSSEEPSPGPPLPPPRTLEESVRSTREEDGMPKRRSDFWTWECHNCRDIGEKSTMYLSIDTCVMCSHERCYLCPDYVIS
jgi:hypothetical protein